MRLLLLALGVLVVTAAPGTRAQAQNYPWCAIFDTGDWTSSCSFTSEDQCWNSVRGVGGFCMVNNAYQPSPPAKRLRRRHQHS